MRLPMAMFIRRLDARFVQSNRQLIWQFFNGLLGASTVLSPIRRHVPPLIAGFEGLVNLLSLFGG
jgi:hypothetical protein